MFSFDWRKWGKQVRDSQRAPARERYSFRPLLEVLEDRVVLSGNNVTTAASAATAFFSPQAQEVPLRATVSDTSNSATTVNEGTVTFTMKDSSGNTVGSPVQATVSNGVATTSSFSLPAGQAVGSYNIDVSYSDSSGDFIDSGDTASTLTVSAANVTTLASAESVAFSLQAQTVFLSAAVTDASNAAVTVNGGNVTFTLKDANGNTVGSPVQGSVSSGIADASFNLPAGQALGSYSIDVSYSDSSGDFTDSGDTASTLTITPPTSPRRRVRRRPPSVRRRKRYPSAPQSATSAFPPTRSTRATSPSPSRTPTATP